MNDRVYLGMLCHDERERDAIHIAVIPMQAGADLPPGQHVAVIDGRALPTTDALSVGVVDPFLLKPVKEGERFWLLVQPFTVRSLHHDWSHPDLPRQQPDYGNMTESEKWLRVFASKGRIDYDDMLAMAAVGDYIVFGTEMYDVPDHERDEFWRHVAVVTGKSFTPEHIQKTMFSCDCI
jgi:hypothetical protein